MRSPVTSAVTLLPDNFDLKALKGRAIVSEEESCTQRFTIEGTDITGMVTSVCAIAWDDRRKYNHLAMCMLSEPLDESAVGKPLINADGAVLGIIMNSRYFIPAEHLVHRPDTSMAERIVLCGSALTGGVALAASILSNSNVSDASTYLAVTTAAGFVQGAVYGTGLGAIGMGMVQEVAKRGKQVANLARNVLRPRLG